MACVFAFAGAASLVNALAIPAENSLLSNISPGKWRGTLFGARFVLSIGVAALGVPLAAFISEAAGDFYRLLMVLAGFSATIVLAAP